MSYKSYLKPSKHLGQNFLVDKNAIKKIVDAAELTKDDIVVEIGAGTGALTTELAKCAKKIIAVEKDRALIPVLRENIKDFENIEIIQGDALKLPLPAAGGEGQQERGWKLVGNIPYYLTAPLIRKFLESPNPPKSLTLMVQKEMAQRICAKPPNMSILAVSVQVYAKPEIIAYISRSAFWPQPRVDSAILKITPFVTHPLSPLSYPKRGGARKDVQLFFEIVKAGFSSPRKQLINNLSKKLGIERTKTERWLVACGIAPERRAETLTINEWIKLAHSML